jgi:hypothetical protein
VDVFAQRGRFRELEEIGSIVRGIVRKNGLEQLPFLLVPCDFRGTTWGRTSLGLRTLFVSSQLEPTRDLLIATALHEYLHCWLGFLKFGPSGGQDKVVSTWIEILSGWASGVTDIELKLDLDDLKNALLGYDDKRCALKNSPAAAEARRLSDRFSSFFAKMVDASCTFEETLDDRFLDLAFDDRAERVSLLLEVDANSTLQGQSCAGKAAACLSYGLLMEDLDQIMKSCVLAETSYEEAICYVMCCQMTDSELSAFDRMTDEPNLALASRISGTGSKAIIDRLRNTDDVWNCMREICARN